MENYSYYNVKIKKENYNEAIGCTLLLKPCKNISQGK